MVDHTAKIDISSVDDFTAGIDLAFGMKSGNEVKTTLESMPELYRTSPYSFSLRLIVGDESKATACIETLNELKQMVVGIPQVQMALESGVQFGFRSEGCNVFVDVHITGEAAAMVPYNKTMGEMGINLVDFLAEFDFHLITGVCPTMILTATPEELLNMATHLKFQGNGHTEHLPALLGKVIDFLQSKQADERKKATLNLIKLASTFTGYAFVFKYVPTVIKDVIQKMFGDQIMQQLQGIQGMGNGFLPTAQQMAPMFIGPYVELLQSLNFGNIEVNAYSTLSNGNLYTRLSIPNLTKWINDTFLSQ